MRRNLKKSTVIFALALSFGLSAIGGTANAISFMETRVTTDARDQSHPAVSGDYITWMDSRNVTWMDGRNDGNEDIYMYRISTGVETRVTTEASGQYSPAISGDYITWEDYRNGNSDIYMYRISTGVETPVTTDANGGSSPTISGDYIAWTEYRNGNTDIYMYRISTGVETRVTTDGSDHAHPAISGDYITWYDNRNGNWEIYMYRISTGVETPVTTDASYHGAPAISGDYITWTDFRNGKNGDIYIYRISTGVETRVTTNASFPSSPAMSGAYITWDDWRNYNADIYMACMDPVYRFYNFKQGVHFYTTSDTEKAYLEGPGGNWTFRYENIAFTAETAQVANTVPVYRFYNFLQGSHFYTADQSEATYVNDNLWWTFSYEGPAYYAYPETHSANKTPVHRFYNFRQGVHFYTADQAEATNVNDNMASTFRYEGIAYYVPQYAP